MLTCTKRYDDIPFAHRQPNHKGHCKLIHGHNWSFEFEFVARELDPCGFVMDFGKLDELKRWVSRFDHAFVINRDDPEYELFEKMYGSGLLLITPVPDCSSEGLAALAAKEAEEIVQRVTLGRCSVMRVTVYEDSRNSATWNASGAWHYLPAMVAKTKLEKKEGE